MHKELQDQLGHMADDLQAIIEDLQPGNNYHRLTGLLNEINKVRASIEPMAAEG